MTWESYVFDFLTASLARPLGLAAAAWLLLRFLRIRHPASRHAVWTAVLLGMLLLPEASVIAPHWTLPVIPPAQHFTDRASETAEHVSVDVEPDGAVPHRARPTNQQAPKVANFALPKIETLIVWCYLLGVCAVALYRLIGWTLLRRVVSRARRVHGRRVMESADLATPVAAGVLLPVVILPTGWREWSAATKGAVLAHEFAHLRRRDTLVAALTRLAQCVLWFHPLTWWLARKLHDLAEFACDAAALEKNDDPAGYSRILLDFADAVNRNGHRTAWPGLAMASSSNMGQRIDELFELSGGTTRKLSRPALFLALIGVPVLCLAASLGLSERQAQPIIKAAGGMPYSEPAHPSAAMAPAAAPSSGKARVRPRTVAQRSATAGTMPVPGPTQTVDPGTPKFEVVSIRPCKDGPAIRGGGRGSSGNPASGRLVMNCQSLKGIIERAYTSGMPPLPPIEGAPAWINSERYTINALAEGNPRMDLMIGPMLRGLLQDRFQLKTHLETREVSAYALTVAKGGSKLKPHEDGNCIDIGMVNRLTTPPPPFPASGERPIVCGMNRPGNRLGPNSILDIPGVSLDYFARTILGIAIWDRPVINKTGLTGLFDIHFEFAREAGNPYEYRSRDGEAPTIAAPGEAGPSIFTALQEQLGLKLEAAKASREFLVIDRVDRPSEN